MDQFFLETHFLQTLCNISFEHAVGDAGERPSFELLGCPCKVIALIAKKISRTSNLQGEGVASSSMPQEAHAMLMQVASTAN